MRNRVPWAKPAKVLLALSLLPTPSLPGCPADMADYKEDGGKYYYLTPESVLFSNSRDECAKVDAALAGIGADSAQQDTAELEVVGESMRLNITRHWVTGACR